MPLFLSCWRPGCTKVVTRDDMNPAIELMKLHCAQAHSIGNTPEKPGRPALRSCSIIM